MKFSKDIDSQIIFVGFGFVVLKHFFKKKVFFLHLWGEGQKSEDNLQELVLPFHYVVFRDATQVLRLGSKHRYPSEPSGHHCLFLRQGLFLIYYFLCALVFSLHICGRLSDSLEAALQAVVSCQVGTGN